MADTVVVGIQAKDETRKGLQSVERGFRRLSTGAGKVFKVVGAGALGLAAGVGALGLGVAALTTNYAANVKEARNISKTTGANIKHVSRLTQIFRRFNLEGEDVRDVLNEINIKLVDAQDEGSAVAQAFDLLNLSAADLQAVGSHEALLQISDALNGVEDAATRAWIADTIFGGDMAQKTLPILAMGRQGIQDLGDEYERLGTVVDEEADKQAQRYEEAQRRISASLQGIGNTIGQTVLPFLADLAERMAPIAEEFAREFGAMLGRVPEFIDKTKPLIISGIQGFLAGDWAAVWTAGRGIVENIFDLLPDALKRPFAELYLMGYTNANRMAEQFVNTGRGIELAIKQAFFNLVDPIGDFLDSIGGGIDNILEGLEKIPGVSNLGRVGTISLTSDFDFTSGIDDFKPLMPSQDFLNSLAFLGGDFLDSGVYHDFTRGVQRINAGNRKFAARMAQLTRLASENTLTTQYLAESADEVAPEGKQPSVIDQFAGIIPGLALYNVINDATDGGLDNLLFPHGRDFLTAGPDMGGNTVNVNVNVEGNVTAEDDLTAKIIDEINRAGYDGRFIFGRSGGVAAY